MRRPDIAYLVHDNLVGVSGGYSQLDAGPLADVVPLVGLAPG